MKNGVLVFFITAKHGFEFSFEHGHIRSNKEI